MPLEQNKIRAICFDVDGTLSDTDDQFVQKLVRILSPFGHLLPGHDINKIARRLVMFSEGPGNWAYNLADRIGLDNEIVAISDRLYQMRVSQNPQPFQIIAGISEMLAALHSRYPLSIISVRGHNSTYRFLLQFRLLPFFTAVATGQTCAHTKPYPDPLEWVAKEMNVPVDSCLMVGDTVVDIQCGKKAGAQTVGVLCGFGYKEELERAGADLILGNTTELTNYFIQD